MGKNADKKMCWNCDATVSVHFASCPYCGVDLSVEPAAHSVQNFESKTIGNPFQQAPHYSTDAEVAALRDPNEETQDKRQEESDESQSVNKDVLTFLLLLPGSVLMLFALFILFFSENGVLTLEWSQNTSYFYFITSLPLLYFGWKVSR